jgi:hypothetical protein
MAASESGLTAIFIGELYVVRKQLRLVAPIEASKKETARTTVYPDLASVRVAGSVLRGYDWIRQQSKRRFGDYIDFAGYRQSPGDLVLIDPTAPSPHRSDDFEFATVSQRN